MTGPNPLVLPTVGAYTNHAGVEAATSIAETGGIIAITLIECKYIDQGIGIASGS